MAERRSIIVVSAVALAVITAGAVVWFLSQPNNFSGDEVVIDSATPTPNAPEAPNAPDASPAPEQDLGSVAQNLTTPSPLPVPMTAATGGSIGFLLAPFAALTAGIAGLLRLKK